LTSAQRLYCINKEQSWFSEKIFDEMKHTYQSKGRDNFISIFQLKLMTWQFKNITPFYSNEKTSIE
jgi:arginine/ornithine N-succinyltransferase beta subunit